MLRTILISAVLAVVAGPLAAEDSGWRNLDRITHSVPYTLILTDGTCRRLRIRAVNPDSLAVVISENDARVVVGKIDRTHIIQVKDDQILYSSRSSWVDVLGIQKLYLHEHLSVALKSGRSVNGEIASLSDDQITLKQPGGCSDIAKSDIAHIDYVRVSPSPKTFNTWRGRLRLSGLIR